jgi:hypothetical protein
VQTHSQIGTDVEKGKSGIDNKTTTATTAKIIKFSV